MLEIVRLFTNRFLCIRHLLTKSWAQRQAYMTNTLQQLTRLLSEAKRHTMCHLPLSFPRFPFTLPLAFLQTIR
jgi:hypothetical protein